MTELYNLKIKIEDRRYLFYGKFTYKTVIYSPGLWYLGNNMSDIKDFRNFIDALSKEDSRTVYQKRVLGEISRIDWKLMTHFIGFRKKYQHLNNETLSFRKERDTIGIFTNDISIVKEIVAFCPDAKVVQAVVMPSGVLYFKKDPPASFRVYFKNISMDSSIRGEIRSYLKRTPDVQPNVSLKHMLNRVHNSNNTYLHNGYFFNYNDERNLLMMHLKFPGALGKTYKLEKKQA